MKEEDYFSKRMTTLSTPHLFSVPGLGSDNGILNFYEHPDFKVQRTFWIHKVPEGGIRGQHAHISENQLLVCVQGKVIAELETLSGELYNFILSERHQVLYLPAQTWAVISFYEDAVMMGMSDRAFSEADYIRRREEFENLQQVYRNSLGISD